MVTRKLSSNELCCESERKYTPALFLPNFRFELNQRITPHFVLQEPQRRSSANATYLVLSPSLTPTYLRIFLRITENVWSVALKTGAFFIHRNSPTSDNFFGVKLP